MISSTRVYQISYGAKDEGNKGFNCETVAVELIRGWPLNLNTTEGTTKV